MADTVATPVPSTVTPDTPADPAAAPAAAAPAASPSAPNPAAASVDPPSPAEPAKPAAPEKYDFAAVKLPKGIELNTDLVSAVSPVFQKYGLTQEAAAELVQAHADALGKIETANEAKREADFKDWMKTTVTNYHAELRKEWGGETDSKLAIAQAGMSKVISPAAKALLDETGIGSHPEIVKAFYQVGLMTREDAPPAASTPPAGGKSAAEMLYGGTNSSQNH